MIHGGMRVSSEEKGKGNVGVGTDGMNMRYIAVCIILACVAACGSKGKNENCVPDCSPEYVCIDGECVEVCNPPCGEGFRCNPETRECEPTGDDAGSDPDDVISEPSDSGDDPGDDPMLEPPVEVVDDTGDDLAADPDATGDPVSEDVEEECDSRHIFCGGTCVDPMTDPYNCGACAVVCPMGADCVYGTCECMAAGTLLCHGSCIDIMSDPANCGGCDVVCSKSGPDCVSGSCGCGSSAPCAPVCDVANCGLCSICCSGTCYLVNTARCTDCSTSCNTSMGERCIPDVSSGSCVHSCEFDNMCACMPATYNLSPAPTQTCGPVDYSISSMDMSIVSGVVLVAERTPFNLTSFLLSGCDDTFAVSGTDYFGGCLDVRLSGTFTDCDTFTGTWSATHDPSVCPGCADYTVTVTGTRSP